jgi:hypothetical protein
MVCLCVKHAKVSEEIEEGSENDKITFLFYLLYKVAKDGHK